MVLLLARPHVFKICIILARSSLQKGRDFEMKRASVGCREIREPSPYTCLIGHYSSYSFIVVQKCCSLYTWQLFEEIFPFLFMLIVQFLYDISFNSFYKKKSGFFIVYNWCQPNWPLYRNSTEKTQRLWNLKSKKSFISMIFHSQYFSVGSSTTMTSANLL